MFISLTTWPVANKLETSKILHVYASLMKYMDFNGLDSAFDVDLIYFGSYAHQTFLVSMSHPSFTLIIISPVYHPPFHPPRAHFNPIFNCL